jgi:hypothetical protein
MDKHRSTDFQDELKPDLLHTPDEVRPMRLLGERQIQVWHAPSHCLECQMQLQNHPPDITDMSGNYA